MAQTPNSLTKPIDIAHGIMRSPSYLAEHNPGMDPVARFKIMSKLAIKGAGVAGESPSIPSNESIFEQRHLSLDKMSKLLYGRVDDFVMSQHDLDRIRKHDKTAAPEDQTPKEVKVPLKLAATRFNHVVSAILDTYPDVSEADIEQFVSESLMMNGWMTAFVNYGAAKARSVLSGMRQENAIEQALWAMNDMVDFVQQPNEESELRGVDRIVHLLDGTTVEIDVKSSQTFADAAMADGHSGNIIVSPFKDADFTNRRVSEAALERELPNIRQKLLDITNKPQADAA